MIFISKNGGKMFFRINFKIAFMITDAAIAVLKTYYDEKEISIDSSATLSRVGANNPE